VLFRSNDLIFSAQGNRNPFVDRPEFVDEVYGGGGE
jgi:endonuclease I